MFLAVTENKPNHVAMEMQGLTWSRLYEERLVVNTMPNMKVSLHER